MDLFGRDTRPEAAEMLLRLLRAASPRRKMEMLAEMWDITRVLQTAHLRQRHPQATEEQIFRLRAGLLLGEPLATEVYGPPPDMRDDATP